MSEYIQERWFPVIDSHRNTFCVVVSLSAKMERLTLKDWKPEEEEEQTKFIAFARVYSGVVKKGQRVFVLGPKYDPAQGLRMVKPQL